MNKKPYEDILLVSDMDGTLLNSSSKISPENLSAINKFTANGGSFTVATGRMSNSVKLYIADLPINAPAILYNGSMIYDFESGKAVWRQDLEDDTKSIIQWVYDNYPDVGIQVYSNDSVYILRTNFLTEKHIAREKLRTTDCVIDDIPFPWIKCMIIGENSTLVKIKEYLKDREISFRSVFSEWNYLEIMHTTTSKGGALNELIRLSGFSKEKVISIGDNLNDVELIQAAGIGIAVENARPELKRKADYCCCSNDEHAIAQVIEWIDQGKLKV